MHSFVFSFNFQLPFFILTESHQCMPPLLFFIISNNIYTHTYTFLFLLTKNVRERENILFLLYSFLLSMLFPLYSSFLLFTISFKGIHLFLSFSFYKNVLSFVNCFLYPSFLLSDFKLFLSFSKHFSHFLSIFVSLINFYSSFH